MAGSYGSWTGRIDSERLGGWLGSEEAADVDEVVSDDLESDPALHAVVATIAATLQPMPTLADADASLASGTPSLPVAEPTLLLLTLAAGALGAVVGNADPLDTFGFCRGLVPAGMEPSISRDQARDASQLCRMYLDRGDQQIRVMRPLRIYFVVNDNLVFRLL